MTNDGLTAFKRVGRQRRRAGRARPGGLAADPDRRRHYVHLPAAAAGSATQTAQPVRPEDFRRALERDCSRSAPSALRTPVLADVVGAAACVGAPDAAVTSRAASSPTTPPNTVTFHLVTPDPEFLAASSRSRTRSRCRPVRPTTTSAATRCRRPVPYEVASSTRLARSSSCATPTSTSGRTPRAPTATPTRSSGASAPAEAAEVTAVERGSADYTLDPPPPDRLHELQTRFASQLYINPTDRDRSSWVSTPGWRRSPTPCPPGAQLRDRPRQDRSLLGQDSHPTCQMLPPFIPGYQPYCPYTLNPSRRGRLARPQPRAKREALIAASGTRGTPITIWNQPGFFTPTSRPSARYLASLLDQLGYPTRVRSFSVNDTTYLPRLADSRTSPRVYFFNWTPNYPGASEFLGPQFWSCQSFVPDSTSNNNLSRVLRSRDSTRPFAAPSPPKPPTRPPPRSSGPKPTRQFTDQAPIVILVTPSTIDFVSHRVGNYEYNPVLGVAARPALGALALPCSSTPARSPSRRSFGAVPRHLSHRQGAASILTSRQDPSHLRGRGSEPRSRGHRNLRFRQAIHHIRGRPDAGRRTARAIGC